MNYRLTESSRPAKCSPLRNAQIAHPYFRALTGTPILVAFLAIATALSHAPRAVADDAAAADAATTTPDTVATETQAPVKTKPKAPDAAADVTADTGTAATPTTDVGAAPAPSAELVSQTAKLLDEAFTVAGRTVGDQGTRARIAAARGAAAVLPRVDSDARDALTTRWEHIVESGSVPRSQRLLAYSSFFDVAARRYPDYARKVALALPDASARTGGFLDLSESEERLNWTLANNDALDAQRAARQESDLALRARALTFVAYRMAVLNPEIREAAVVEASSQVRLISTSSLRDDLLTDVVGAAAKYDLILARRIAESISDPGLKALATARINISEISQTTLAGSTSDRVAALAKAAVRYDVRAIPILIQLPPQADVLKTLGDALPPIYPSAAPGISASLLERMWAYAQTADASVQRDQLQSRLARLMVMYDLWRGRDWGKQLAWKGGRIQVGAFLKEVTAARRSTVKAEPLQDLATRNVNRAILQARGLPPASRVEATLLIAGQILA